MKKSVIEIMGEEGFIGPEDIQNTFGFTPKYVPDVPFSQDELIRAKELGHQLILYVNDLTLEEMIEAVGNNTRNDTPVLRRPDQIKYAEIEDTAPRLGWRLTSPEITEGTTGKNYLEQTEALITYLKKKVFEGQDMPEVYQIAIEEFESKKEVLQHLLESDWKKSAQHLSTLTIDQWTRENTSEVIYRLILTERKTGKFNLKEDVTWTNTVSHDGNLMSVDGFNSNGLTLLRRSPSFPYGNVSACLSRSE